MTGGSITLPFTAFVYLLYVNVKYLKRNSIYSINFVIFTMSKQQVSAPFMKYFHNEFGMFLRFFANNPCFLSVDNL